MTIHSGWPITIVDGKRYAVLVNLTVTRSSEGVTFDCGRLRPVRKCDRCGRADWVPDIAYSWDEVVEKGWAVESTSEPT